MPARLSKTAAAAAVGSKPEPIRRSRRIRNEQPSFEGCLPPTKRRRTIPILSPMDVLPTEVLMHVFQELDMTSLLTVSQVCRRFRQVALSPYVWRQRMLTWTDEEGDLDSTLNIVHHAPYLHTLHLQHVPVCVGRAILQGRLKEIRTLKVSDQEVYDCNVAKVLRRYTDTLKNLDLKLKMSEMSEKKVLELWEGVNQMKQLLSLRLAGYLPCRLTYNFPSRILRDQTLLALDLYDFEADHATTMLSLIAAHHTTIVKLTLPDSLSEEEMHRVLDLLRVTEELDMTIGGHIDQLNGLPLRRLTLRHKNESCSSRFLERVSDCTALAGVQELCVSWSDGDLRDPVLSSLAALCPKLRVLRLHNMCDDKAPGLAETVREFDQISELQLDKFYPMDVQFVDELAMGALPRLTRLSFQDVLIGVPHTDPTACANSSPCYDHHFDRLSYHRKNLVFVFHDFPECWHRHTNIRHNVSCYCDMCMEFYAYMANTYNFGEVPSFWSQ